MEVFSCFLLPCLLGGARSSSWIRWVPVSRKHGAAATGHAHLFGLVLQNHFGKTTPTKSTEKPVQSWNPWGGCMQTSFSPFPSSLLEKQLTKKEQNPREIFPARRQSGVFDVSSALRTAAFKSASYLYLSINISTHLLMFLWLLLYSPAEVCGPAGPYVVPPAAVLEADPAAGCICGDPSITVLGCDGIVLLPHILSPRGVGHLLVVSCISSNSINGSADCRRDLKSFCPKEVQPALPRAGGRDSL